MDSRSAAEKPSRMAILHQGTGEPIMDGKKECAVLIKGLSSRSAQAQMRAEEAARMKSAKGRKLKAKDAEEKFTRDLQKSLCESAARFIVGFENVQRPGEGGSLRDLDAAQREDVDWFLDLNLISIPHLLRGDGSDIARKDDEDEDEFAFRKRAEMDAWLKPSFSQQIIDWSRDDSNFLASDAQP